jgi:hypothetical protein
MKMLICCSCAGEAPGKQWWNRDTSYGICARCFRVWVAKMGFKQAVFSCGSPGIHHSPGAKPEDFPDNYTVNYTSLAYAGAFWAGCLLACLFCYLQRK